MVTKPKRPVLEQRIDHHQQQADQAGQQAHAQLLAAEGGGDLLFALDVEADGQGTEAELVGQRLGRLLGEAAGDLRAAVGDHGQGPRGGNDLVVQDDGELGLGIVAGLAAGGHVELVQALGDRP